MNSSTRILIVEDNAVLLLNLQAMLGEMGYLVAGRASTGVEAVAAALAEKPDAVLMDIHLSGAMDGIQAAQAIRQKLDIPIIYLTAYTDDGLLEQAKLSGGYGFLQKPVRERELRASLEMTFFKHAAERRHQHQNQVLRAIRDVNKLIRRAPNAQYLLEEAANILLNTRGYRCVWVGQILAQSTNIQAFAGEGRALLEQMLREDSQQTRLLPAAQAALTRQNVVCQNMLLDERCQPWRAEIEQLNLHSSVALPILHQDTLYGVFSVYAEQTDHFDPEECELLTELAGEIAFGLKAITEQAERRQAEETLRRSEAKYRAVIENSQDGIVFTDALGNILYRSPSLEQITGFTALERLGKSGFEAIHPDDLNEWRQVWDKAIQNPGVTYRWEYRSRHKNGSNIWIESTIQSLIEDPDFQGIIITNRDITARKSADEALRKSEQTAHQTAEQLRMVNQIGYAIETGLDMEHLLQTLYEQCQNIGDADTFYLALYDDTTSILRFPFYYKSGERRYPEPRNLNTSKGVSGLVISQRKTLYLTDLNHLPEWAAPILQPGPLTQSYVGIPLIAGERVIGVFSMQSARTNAYTAQQIETLELLATQIAIALQNSQLYEEVQREKKLAEAVVDNLPGVFTLIDQQGKILRWNNFAEEKTGFSKAEIRQMNILDLIPETERGHISSSIPEVFNKGHLNLETQLRTKNSEAVIPIYVTSSRAQFGDDIYLVSIGIDITERKQREIELQAISALSTALRAAPTRVEMLPVIVQQVQSLLRCDSVSIEMIDPQTGDILIEAAVGVWAPLIGTHQNKNTGIDALISKTQEPFYTPNLAEEPNLPNPAWARVGIRGATVAPLIAQEKLIGFIWGGSHKELTPADVRLLSAIADIAANAIYRATLHEQTKKDATRLELAYDTTLEGWAHALELRDQETEGHTRRVTQKTVELGRLLGIRGTELEDLRRGALLHDIGKMGIPDSVLLKPGTLDEREWEIMRRHPEYAVHMLSQIEYLHNALEVSYCHHEKWDGSGYPRGLKGTEIPLPARVFALVDVWDALTSDRPYRRAWKEEDALRYIRQQSGKHFDPAIAEVFLNLLDLG